MIPLSYALSNDLRERLHTIDALRTRILCKTIRPEQEQSLRWDATVTRIQGSFTLANVKMSKKDVIENLQHASIATGYKKALDVIRDAWAGSDETLRTNAVEIFTQAAYTGVFARYKKTLHPMQPSIRQLLTYLDNQTEHPVVRAGIALGIMSGSIFPPEEPGLAARLVSCAFLAKDGYDLRGLSAPEYQWAHDTPSYTQTLATIRQNGDLNLWLLFFASSIELDFSKKAESIGTEPLRRLPNTIRLNERQRAIVHLVDNPNISITNKIVQKQFRISQITASRDLTKLASLGFLISHDKGRSVSYTGI